MKIELSIKLPSCRGAIVDTYKQVFKVEEEYKAYTLNDSLEIVEGIGLITNDGNYNYHNNYDDSEDVLML